MAEKLSEIIAYLETIAPASLQESYDNSGLLVGNRNKMIHQALISLDCTEDVVQEAMNKNCDLIISHHPIVFGGLKRLTGSNYVERTVELAVKNDIALYAIHTNLDNVLHSGVNSKIAEKLGLERTSILSPQKGKLLKLQVYTPVDFVELVSEALFAAGAGRIGNYSECSFQGSGLGTFKPLSGANPFTGTQGVRSREDEVRLEVVLPEHTVFQVLSAMKQAHPYEEVAYDLIRLENEWQEVGSGLVGYLPNELNVDEFLGHLKQSMELPLVKFTPLESPDKKIKKVAICGGSGSFLTKMALAQGCDAYVTADVKYHEFFDSENRMLLCDIGHFESEKYTIDLISDILSKKFRTFATIFAQSITNPVQYFI